MKKAPTNAALPKRIRVLLLVLPHVLGELLGQHLARSRRFEAVGLLARFDDAIERCSSDHVDLVLGEAHFFLQQRLETLQSLQKVSPRTGLIVFNAPPNLASHSFAIEGGALGYLSTDATGAELLLALDTVHSGRHFWSQTMLRLVEADYLKRASNEPRLTNYRLTDREQEIDEHYARGERAKAIAVELHVSSRTIEKHHENIVKKCRSI